MGASGSTGPDAVASAEKNAALLTAKAGARDLSAIPSICRVSSALQYSAGELLVINIECWSHVFRERTSCLLPPFIDIFP
jgi:hypothetical protein